MLSHSSAVIVLSFGSATHAFWYCQSHTSSPAVNDSFSHEILITASSGSLVNKPDSSSQSIFWAITSILPFSSYLMDPRSTICQFSSFMYLSLYSLVSNLYPLFSSVFSSSFLLFIPSSDSCLVNLGCWFRSFISLSRIILSACSSGNLLDLVYCSMKLKGLSLSSTYFSAALFAESGSPSKYTCSSSFINLSLFSTRFLDCWSATALLTLFLPTLPILCSSSSSCLIL